MLAQSSEGGEVRVFGSFRLSDAAGRALRLEARSAASLCAYLAARWRGAARSEIAEAIWPGAGYDAGRAALRTAVYRVRHAAGDAALLDEDGRLRLTLASDAFEAARLRRERQRARDSDAALAAASAEWSIVRHELLEGWDDAWIEPVRTDAQLLANDCGAALARLQEERGDPSAAIETLDGILRAVPYHAHALEQAMRLEHVLYGRERALARSDAARASLAGTELSLPASVRRLDRAIREGVAGFIPPPPAFSDGADLALIGHMLESSLRQGGTAALGLLAEQAFSPVCTRHPHRTLDLLRKAIRLTDGYGEERCVVFAAAITMAASLPDNEAIHELCDALIADLPPHHRMHSGSLMMKGTAFMNVGDWDRARDLTERAVATCDTEGRRLVAAAQLGMIDAQEGRFEDALRRYLPALESLAASDREDRQRNVASLQTSICLARLALGQFPEAVAAGEAARASLDEGVAGEVLAATPHGLALVLSGRHAEGVERIGYGLRESLRARLSTAFVRAVEHAAVALSVLGRSQEAVATLDAATALRRAADVPRAPGERLLIERLGRLHMRRDGSGPLRLQSAGGLADWIGETLQGAVEPGAKRG